MKAVSCAGTFTDTTLPDPVATGRDLLVRVQAVSVNPVDTKVARGIAAGDPPRILGWDATGVVEQVGAGVSLFRPGDRVFYAGSILRPGSNAELQLVDERIVGPAPASLTVAAAAALPLTAITAWEMLFDRLLIPHGTKAPPDSQAAPATLLIIGGAGGVGSIAIQLARTLSNVTVVATASRPETQDWCRELGAHHVIDHHQELAAQLAELDIAAPRYVFITTHSDRHFEPVSKLIAPFGAVGLIDDVPGLNVSLLKDRSCSLHWELMFTRAKYETADMQGQHDILANVARLIDAGTLRTTLTRTTSPICASSLTAAHELQRSATLMGKQVIEGW